MSIVHISMSQVRREMEFMDTAGLILSATLRLTGMTLTARTAKATVISPHPLQAFTRKATFRLT